MHVPVCPPSTPPVPLSFSSCVTVVSSRLFVWPTFSICSHHLAEGRKIPWFPLCVSVYISDGCGRWVSHLSLVISRGSPVDPTSRLMTLTWKIFPYSFPHSLWDHKALVRDPIHLPFTAGSARCTPDGYGRAAVSQRECLCVLARDLPFFDKETGSPWHGCGFVPPPFTLPLASSVLFARPKLLSLLPKIQEREVMLGNAVLRVPLSLSLTRNNKEAEWKGEEKKKGCWGPSGV